MYIKSELQYMIPVVFSGVQSLYFLLNQCEHPFSLIRVLFFRLNKRNVGPQSELPRPIPWNSVGSDLGCTSRIYFDNVTLALFYVTLTSQKTCQHNNKRDCSKTNGYKWIFFQYNLLSIVNFILLIKVSA